MSLQAEIAATLQATQLGGGVQLDPATGRRWGNALQRALGGEVQESTDYTLGRAYTYNFRLPLQDDWPWRAILRIRVSAVGPYATQMLLQVHRVERWWTGIVASSRRGWLPEHAEMLERLRRWYTENGLQEISAETAAQPAPAGVKVAGLRGNEVIVYEALFHG